MNIIVVPVYNEAQRLDIRTFDTFQKLNPSYLFLFVDDGSTDSTAALVKAYQEAENCGDRLRLLRLSQNQGKAEAVRQGVLWAFKQKPDFIGYFDADLATPLAELLGFHNILTNKPYVDLVTGARVKLVGRYVKRNPLRHYVGRVFATLASITLNLPVYDTQCGAKLMRNTKSVQDAFSSPFLSRWLFDVELIARLSLNRKSAPHPLARENQDCMYEYVLDSWEDKAGSKVDIRAYFRSLKDLGRIYRKYHAQLS